MIDLHGDLPDRLARALGADYRIERELGRGGMGVVYLATDVALDRTVAVKVIHPELAANESLARRFLAEARTIAKLRHPSIVAVHTAGAGEDLLYYVMDVVPGETLRQRLLRERRLDPGEAARITADLAAALDAAGAAGIVHRDVKPENVLLDRDTGRALLADFGIARVLQQAEGTGPLTGSGVAVGTPAYMSPEQASGEEVDSRSDLYSLGVVAYEMLTGQPPFEGPNRVVVSRHIAERPAPMRRSRADIPAHISDAVMQALEKNPGDRWQRGADFRRALEGEVRARRRTPGLRRAIVAGVTVALVAAAATAALAGRDGGPPPGVDPRHSLLVLPFDNLRNDSTLAWLGQGSVSGLAISLSQWNDMQVVDAKRVHDLLARNGVEEGEPVGLDLARRMAREAGVWTVALGHFERVGDSLRLVAQLYDVHSGDALETARTAGAASADPLTLFDELAFQMLDLSGAPTEARTRLAQSTTSSLAAFRAYLQGVDALNHWDLAAAERALSDATAIDSTFGLAYYNLALTRGWLVGAEDSLSDRAMARAMANAAPLPLHERTIITAYRSFLQGEYPAARNLYQQLIARDSTDADAWYGLGEAWFHDFQPADGRAVAMTNALRAFRRTLELDPEYVLAYEHIEQMLGETAGAATTLALMPGDSFVPVRDSRGRALPGADVPAATARAQQSAVALAERWVTTQPTTLRAHGALVDAYISSSQYANAFQEVDRFRAVSPDHPELPFVEARIHFAAGRVDQAATLLRAALDSASPEDFRGLESTPTVFGDLASAANVFAYQGDLDNAARVIELADQVRQTVFTYLNDAGGDNWQRTALGQLYAAAGAPAASLRRVWQSAAEEAREAPAEKRPPIVASGAAAAIGLFTGLDLDTTALYELAALSGEQLPSEVRALLALSGPRITAADSAAARKALAEPDTVMGKLHYVVYRRPLAAQAHAALGDYRRALELLEGFEPSVTPSRRFDPRWAMVGRVRLLRADILAQLGERERARTEYERVLAQWDGADPALERYVRFAREGLARLGVRG